MKSKWRNQIQIVKYITHTEKFKGFYFFSIIIALYGSFALASGQKNIFDGVLTTFQFGIFNILMFALFFLNTIHTCSLFEQKFDFYIIRLQSKKRYIIELCKTNLLLNLYLFLLFIMYYFIFLIFVQLGNFETHVYVSYEVNDAVYMVFYMVRYVVFLLLSCSFLVFLHNKWKEKWLFAFIFLFLILFLVLGTSADVQTFTFLLWKYFDYVNYGSFSLEVLYSLLYLLIGEGLFYYILYRYGKGRKIL